jgi:hypothetical protein
VSAADLATLIDLGLVEMRDDVPVLTEAGHDLWIDGRFAFFPNAGSVALTSTKRQGAVSKTGVASGLSAHLPASIFIGSR